MGMRWIFDGHIAGIGTASGLRAVVGLWQESPFGRFADAMVELPSGRRILLAPTAEVAGFIAAVYCFDETLLVDIAVRHAGGTLTVDAGRLLLEAAVGARTALGTAARLIPRPLAVHPRWLRAVSPFAGLLSPGVRTAGTAGGGRREYYGVTDLHRIDAATVSWDGVDAGTLAKVVPAVGFGFSSVPPEPGIARVRTTVEGAPVTLR
ncbi:hypothetical protein SAMN04487914_109155 [Arthrobacter sp. ok909]|uniref:hypothetical protein n=1 Tax=Arthrobacter sp. ok909 TaxID=1761746 RepID=UPI00088E7D3B|nr:hypothetical protein [Arthrobacter sp. ok909]SDP38434.1 hypothetical protein SAMN04487914_109155 [Arthrobacter sp. ok909]